MNEGQIKINDNPNLVKNLTTGVVVNTDSDAYVSAIARKRRNKELQKLKNEVIELKERVSRLESLLQR